MMVTWIATVLFAFLSVLAFALATAALQWRDRIWKRALLIGIVLLALAEWGGANIAGRQFH